MCDPSQLSVYSHTPSVHFSDVAPHSLSVHDLPSNLPDPGTLATGSGNKVKASGS